MLELNRQPHSHARAITRVVAVVAAIAIASQPALPAAAADPEGAGEQGVSPTASDGAPPATFDLSSGRWRALDSNGLPVEGATYFVAETSVSPVVSVTDGENVLPDGSYILKYEGNKDAPGQTGADGVPSSATASVRVVGIESKGATGSFATRFALRRYNLASPDEVIVGGISEQAVSSSEGAASPKPTLKTVDGKQLVENRDYVLSYDGGAAGGKGKVTATAITGKGSLCAGSVSKSFTATSSQDLSGAVVSAIGDCSYTGKPVQPRPAVKLLGRLLTEGVDYSLSYDDNIEVGTATLTVSGKGSYRGSQSIRFRIVAADAAAGDISAAETSQIEPREYSGAEQKPELTVSAAGKSLEKGKDYTVEFRNNVNAGTAEAILKGTGVYTGTLTKTFEIRRASISKANFSGIAPSKYTGSAISPDLSGALSFGGKALGSKDFKVVSHADNVAPGKASVTIEGTGNFEGTRTLEYSIESSDISKAEVSRISSTKTTGYNKIEVSLDLKLGGKKLGSGDYKLSFAKKNKKGKLAAIKLSKIKTPGTYYAVVEGKGAYGGKKTVKFEVPGIGDDLARMACFISYSKRTVYEKTGRDGTKRYWKALKAFKPRANSRTARGCDVVADVAWQTAGYEKDKNTTDTRYKQINYLESSSRWKCLGKYKKGMEDEGKLMPGDVLTNNAHICIYVGHDIVMDIYKRYLKGTDADLGKPLSNACWVSGSYHTSFAACICDREGAYAGSGTLYRCVKPIKPINFEKYAKKH